MASADLQVGPWGGVAGPVHTPWRFDVDGFPIFHASARGAAHPASASLPRLAAIASTVPPLISAAVSYTSYLRHSVPSILRRTAPSFHRRRLHVPSLTSLPPKRSTAQVCCLGPTPSQASADLQVGPWGGVAGSVHTPWREDIHGRICKIEIRCGGFVHAIRFVYKDDAGNIHFSLWIGGSGGVLQPPIEIPDDEEITQIIGTVGDILIDSIDTTSDTIKVITSLTFQTIKNSDQTKKTYGPYGMVTGENFSLPLEKGKWAGFFGNKGDYNLSLGVILKPLENWVRVAPWGGKDGKPWQFTSFRNQIRTIGIKYGRCVHNITFSDSIERHSANYDGDGGSVTIITISDGEEIVRVSGTVGVILTDSDDHDTIVITSLTFQTTKYTYGPYGKEIGEHFSLPLKQGKFDALCHSQSENWKLTTNFGAFLM